LCNISSTGSASGASGDIRRVIREELDRLCHWEERHRRLVARLLLVFLLTAAVDVAGALLTWLFERHAKGTDIHRLGDAFFFATVQLLTVSSSLKNPLTAAGRAVDVVLEAWAIFVVTAAAGSFAAFFHAGDGS
jgi:drug/metabolite transporter superfamily protein YnfA